jgi:hypothetical protein
MLGPALPRFGTPIGIDLTGNGGFDRVSLDLGWDPMPSVALRPPYRRIAAGAGNTTLGSAMCRKPLVSPRPPVTLSRQVWHWRACEAIISIQRCTSSLQGVLFSLVQLIHR